MLVNLAKNLGTNFQFIALLLIRFQMGVLFTQAGWGKFQNLQRTVGFFQSLGIPAPAFMAPFVAAVELLGGLMLISGLFSRLASVALICVMVVAALTAHMGEFTDFVAIVTQKNIIYIVMLFAIFCFGPGRASIDSLVFGEKA